MDKDSVKKFLPSPIWKAGSRSYWWWYNRGRHVIARVVSPLWLMNINHLHTYENKHAKKRAFIIGNGPSLKNMDLRPLKNEITFGLNRAYLMFAEVGFSTTFLVSVNDLVLEQCASEMSILEIPKLVTWRARKYFTPDKNTLYIDSDYTGKEDFNTKSMTARIYEGYTVTYVALQLAYLMGISTVILIGVDHNFSTKGPANAVVVSNGNDPNHFSSSYFGKGFKWQLPDLEGSERSYHLARRAYEADGREVIDATVGGKLTIFKKADFKSLF